jgi:aspartyl-tRNA(Asn)/glutamyl-tRNA(Gln) amidotransferase subunit A
LSSEFGFEIVDISLPMVKYALPIYYIIAPAEASSNLARYDGVKYGTRVEGENIFDMYYKTRNAGFGDEVKRRIFIGTFVLSSGYYDAYYLKAQKAITIVIKEFQEAFSKVDVIACPTSPEVPFKLGEKTDDPIKMYLSDIFTIPSSIAGLPAISCPAGFVLEDGKKLPVGLQVIGKPFDEATILFVAKCVELLKLE